MSTHPPQTERSTPLSVRFTGAEKTRLKEMAGTRPLSLFIRERALDGSSEPRKSRRTPVRDADALGQLLGLLGQSRLANNLNQLAKAANLGSLPVTVELEGELRQACANIFEMRSLLLQALGVELVSQALNVADSFAGAAARPAE